MDMHVKSVAEILQNRIECVPHLSHRFDEPLAGFLRKPDFLWVIKRDPRSPFVIDPVPLEFFRDRLLYLLPFLT